MSDIKKSIDKLFNKQSICFIGTIDNDGFPNIKALLRPGKHDGIKTFWFSTNTSSRHVSQYRNNPKACVYVFDRLLFKGVMLKGEMDILEDDESKKMLWKFGDTQYYKKGVTDPDYCVMKLTVNDGRYYSNFKSENFEV